MNNPNTLHAKWIAVNNNDLSYGFGIINKETHAEVDRALRAEIKEMEAKEGK